MMNRTILITVAAIFTSMIVLAHDDGEVVKPAKISQSDVSGEIYNRSNMVKTTHKDGHTSLDVSTLVSSSGEYCTGMYRSEETHMEVTEHWGVDEFFYVIEGSITLTSSDGTVMTINSGEAASIPEEWTGRWDTEGYSKIWSVHSEDLSYCN